MASNEIHGVNRGTEEEKRERIMRFLLALRSQGVRDHHLLRAFETVPRSLFVPHDWQDRALDERALPTDCGQTISAPYIVARMSDELQLKPSHKVLEIGTGSGYQTAILAKLAARIYTIERFRTLSTAAKARFATLKLDNIEMHIGDGFKGWPDGGPFDRIIVTAAPESLPMILAGQLTHNGIMIVPIGPQDGPQKLVRVIRDHDTFNQEPLIDVKFVPMVSGEARYL